jgi:hypothetical protein
MALLSVWLLSRDAELAGNAPNYVVWWHYHGGPTLAWFLAFLFLHSVFVLGRNIYVHNKVIGRQVLNLR